MLPSSGAIALKMTFAPGWAGEAKSGIGSRSLWFENAFVENAPWPKPCRANSSQSSFRFDGQASVGSLERIRSAARYASRASSIDGPIGMSRYAS